MARSWERMVQKNSQQLNKQRKKQGKDGIHAVRGNQDTEVFKGRNFILPITLVGLGVLYWLIGTVDQQRGNGSLMNWLGVVLYFALAAMIFFRKPYLKVERSRLSTFKFNRERILHTGDIEKISVSKGAVVIHHKTKRSKWVFSRLTNRFNPEAMGEKLESFAKNNKITFERE